MPGFDKTGPAKNGPLTGHQQGPCNKEWSQNNYPPQRGRGMGRFGQNTNSNKPSDK